jgi:hypothetical protein
MSQEQNFFRRQDISGLVFNGVPYGNENGESSVPESPAKRGPAKSYGQSARSSQMKDPIVDNNWNYRFILIPEGKLLKDPKMKDYCIELSVGSGKNLLQELPIHNEIVMPGYGFQGKIEIVFSRRENGRSVEIEHYSVDYDQIEIEGKGEWTEKSFNLPLHTSGNPILKSDQKKQGSVMVLIQRTERYGESIAVLLADGKAEMIMLENHARRGNKSNARKQERL